MTRHYLSFAQTFLIALILVFLTVSCDKKEEAGLSLMQQKIDSYDLKAKQKVIDAAGSAFVAEQDRNPKSLEELVASGYLDKASIVDRNGNPLPFDPENLTINTSGPTTVLISKSCEACGKAVSKDSKVGDICPHCHVRWGHEVTKFAN